MLRRFMECFYEQPEAKLSLFSKLYAILEQLQNHLSIGVRQMEQAYGPELPSPIALEIQSLVLGGSEPAMLGGLPLQAASHVMRITARALGPSRILFCQLPCLFAFPFAFSAVSLRFIPIEIIPAALNLLDLLPHARAFQFRDK